jgi:hypothetical protein
LVVVNKGRKSGVNDRVEIDMVRDERVAFSKQIARACVRKRLGLHYILCFQEAS